jgi:ubiquinone/menaquinone biosynthesis C-methylase UbiE
MLKRKRNILDVTTGTGKIPLILENNHREIFAIDISEEMVKVARKKAKVSANKNIYFQIADGLKLQSS